MLKKVLLKILFSFPFLKKNVIILENNPDFDGSPMKVERDLKKKFPEGKFLFVWAVDKHCAIHSQEKTVAFWGGLTLIDKIKKYFYLARAILIIDSNRPVFKWNPKTIRIYTSHGGSLKNCDKYMHSIGKVDYYLTLSDYLANVDFEILKGRSVSSREQILPIGLPLNDVIFEDFDLYRCGLLKEKCYDKIIGWLPTFRQHKNNDQSISLENEKKFSLPLFQSQADFDRIDAFLASKNTLLIVQLHPCQISLLPANSYGNILFITQEQKNQYGITNMNLLHCFDAMITDYSAAYYEFLLLNRPIGLTIDDYEEYAAKIGFYIDYKRLVQGERLSKIEDLETFINHVVTGNDVSREDRERSLHEIHNYADNLSSERLIDFIASKIDL